MSKLQRLPACIERRLRLAGGLTGAADFGLSSSLYCSHHQAMLSSYPYPRRSATSSFSSFSSLTLASIFRRLKSFNDTF